MSVYHRKPFTFVGQIKIKVENKARSIEFYRDVLGFSVLEEDEATFVLTADGKSPLITIYQPKDVLPKEHRTTGLYHFAILLPSRTDLGILIKRLSEKGYPINGASHHGISEAIYLSDPDGNGIEIYGDTSPDTWKWENGLLPVEGKALDIDDLLAEAKGKRWHKMPSNALIGHIHLSVSELEKTEKFYRDGLGFDVVMRIPRQAVFFSTGKYHHHIAANVWNGIGAPAPRDNSVGISSFSIIYPDEKAREIVIKQLHDIGYKVNREEGVLFTEDPSGNKILLLSNL